MNHNTKDRRNWSSTAQLLSALRRNGCTVVKHGLPKLDEDDFNGFPVIAAPNNNLPKTR